MGETTNDISIHNLLSGMSEELLKQWQRGKSEQAIFYYQQQSNFYLPDTMTP